MDDLLYIEESFQDNIKECSDPESVSEWARFGIFLGHRFLIEIRKRRLLFPSFVKNLKDDGSPATLFEDSLEIYAREKLHNFYPDAGYIGEESGDLSNSEEIILIVDPIDGTRSFLSGFDSYAVTISILKNKKPLFSLVCAPSTGDIGYRIDSQKSKLFQSKNSFEDIKLLDLPLMTEKEHLLVNIHPSKSAGPIIKKLYHHWNQKDISLVRSVSGSPSLMLLEVARGCGVYINTWDKGKTDPFDILPALHLLQGCGGVIIDKNSNSIDPWNHEGLFLAGLDKQQLIKLLSFITYA